MAADAMLFVSKRVSVAAAALLCLMAVRFFTPPVAPASPSEVRVAIMR